jgi:hypothetical protein
MNSKHLIVTSEEISSKYDESGISENLHLFKKLVDEETGRYCGRITETYKDLLSRKKVLVRHFFKRENGPDKMTITYFRYLDTIYEVDRISQESEIR